MFYVYREVSKLKQSFPGKIVIIRYCKSYVRCVCIVTVFCFSKAVDLTISFGENMAIGTKQKLVELR